MANQKKARVLVDCTVSGVSVQCGTVINADEKEVNALVKQGVLDIDKTAVDFALESGVDIIELQEDDSAADDK